MSRESGIEATSEKRLDDKSPLLPPESPLFITTRRLILAGFWVVVLALGLPHWIWTTSIHRSNLPVDLMTRWSEGQACQLQYPITIELESSSISLEQQYSIAVRTESLLKARTQDSLYSFRVAAKGVNHITTDAAAIAIRFTQDDSTVSLSSTLRSWEPVLDVHHGPLTSAADDTLAAYLTHEIQQIFDDEQASIVYLLRDSSFQTGNQARQLTAKKAQLLDKRTTRAFKYASTYHLTFSLFAASTAPSSWEIEAALKRHVEPLIHSLSAVSDFTIDTQVQLYASFSPSIAGPQLDPATNTWKLLQSDLSGFVNAAEWPLSPSIGSGPTLNMVLYVPRPEQSPLLLETGGSSWIIPQWGGVQIFNPSSTQSERLTVSDLEGIMLTFADQLMSLLNVPNSPSSLSMRIASLQRERATSLILSASSTLGALVRLTRKLESIAIPKSVAHSVDETIHRLDQACSDLSKGRFKSALEHARIAEAEAEKAFFEPSMVGQVYFPEEHKVAVYVPLLGPMAVPLVMSAIKELRSLRQAKVKTN